MMVQFKPFKGLEDSHLSDGFSFSRRIPSGSNPSEKNLKSLSGEKVTDLHHKKIDHITIPSPRGHEEFGVLNRVEDDVFDCWFESGSIPYAYIHDPFEDKDFANDNFPRDFIAYR
ncbi:isoleucine--tRNA ligase, cytoplasmic [Tanacetum coccineum]